MNIINKNDVKNLAITILYTDKKGIKETKYLSTDYADFDKMFNLLLKQEELKIGIGISLSEKNVKTKEFLRIETQKDFENYSVLIKSYFKRIKESFLRNKLKSKYVPFLMQMTESKDGTKATAVVTPVN